MAEKTKITPRPYQLELLEAAMEENTIVVLGTGTGKTFVSVLLIRELQHQILGGYSTHKRTIFLVTTVPLVAQQAKVVRDNLDVNVGEFKGDSKIDTWNKQMWLSKFEQHHVLVMTAQIFVNILSAGFVPLDKINLVIFDECHHATKDHPYCQVMRLFDILAQSDEIPRVLGLTAALIQGKCRAFEVEKRITQLEKVLQCRAQTSQDLITVHKFATRPDEHIITFNSNQDNQNLINIFTKPIQFLAEFPKKSKSTAYEIVKDLLADCSEVLEEVGSTILYRLIEECNCLNYLEAFRNKPLTAVDEALVSLCYTHLRMFKQQCMNNSEVFVTSKVKHLLQILEDFGIKNGESTEVSTSIPLKERLCGIIFVQQRSTALALSRMIQFIARTKPELQYIHCAHIVGHGTTQSQNGPIAKRADMTTAQQQGVLSRFRTHKVNLLVSTSVVEEGLDVPQCNLVIRYSLPDDVCSYLQSRGRARASKSQYIMMVDDKHSRSFSAQLRDMQQIEKMLEKLCYGRHVPVVDDDDEEEEDQVKNVDEIIPPFCPHGKGTQIRATATSSIQLLYMYCQRRLSSDDFYRPVPIFKISKARIPSLSDSMYEEVMSADTQYQCTITMPTSCPLFDPIIGRPMETAKLAKRDASVEVVCQLYDKKELDSNLLPVVTDDGGEDEDESELQEEKKILDAGTLRRKQKYKVQYAELLSECYPLSYGYLYMIMVHSASEKRPQGIEGIKSYGIFTKQHLKLDDSDVTLYQGNEKLRVTLHRLEERITFSPEDIKLYMDFHYALFDKILGLNGAHLETKDFGSSSKCYIIIPITIMAGSGSMTALIDDNLMRAVVHNERTLKWPCFPDKYSNRLVEVNHRSDIDSVTHNRHLYRVTKVYTNKSPRSSFPADEWSTYQDFYRSKYNYSFSDPNQPLIEVTYASNRLELLIQRPNHSYEGEEMAKKTMELFPEICDVHPLSVEMYKLARLLPSFLYRMESMWSAYELINAVKLNSYGAGEFKSPSFSSVVEALTLQGVQDQFNMERLELLGDAFLKMVSTVYLHSKLPNTAMVSTITNRRSTMISNTRLYYLAKKKNIPNKMKATVFKARNTWLPPGFKLNDDKRGEPEYDQIASQMIADKRVADCVEALVGAYILSGGIVAGFRFLEWLGFFKEQHSSVSTTTSSTSLPSNPLDILLTSSVLGDYLKPRTPKRRPADDGVEKKLFAGLQKFDNLWRFRDKYFLVEAMTHISYTYNRVTDSYQHLELLGDAILDYLIISYIYCKYPDYDEGKVSLLRSAIVNNTSLALFALVYDFHKAVKHNSPKLFSKIQQFTAASTEIVQQLKSYYGDVVHYESDNDMDAGDDDVDTLDPPKVLADIVESLVGAVFLDSNKDLARVWSVFQPLFQPFIEKFSKKLPVSAVRKLLETDIGGTATFRKQKCNDREVECVVKIKGKGIVVSAVASNYKAAKRAASKMALSEL